VAVGVGVYVAVGVSVEVGVSVGVLVSVGVGPTTWNDMLWLLVRPP